MDYLYREYGNPTILIDGLISSCQFSAWIDAQQEEKDEKTLWEMYLHKLGAWDERSFNDFKTDIMNRSKPKPSQKQLSATVKQSYNLLNNFEMEGG